MRQLSIDFRRNQAQQAPLTRLRRYRRPNLPVLFYSIIGRSWEAALRRIRTHPHEMFSVEDLSGDTPLHYACRLDPPLEIIRSLMPICDEQNTEGATALHVAASHRCSPGIIKILVNHEFVVEGGTSITLLLSNKGRTPLHYACSSFRGLGFDAFQVLLEATINAYVSVEEKTKTTEMELKMHEGDTNSTQIDLNGEFDWEGNSERTNAFTMQDRLGHTPLSLLFKRYRERVKFVIRSLERHSSSSSVASLKTVQNELGELWLKARLIVCSMSVRKKEEPTQGDGLLDLNGDNCAVAREAARWAAQRHQSSDFERDEEEEETNGTVFRLVHASVALVGYGCPIEMIRLAMSVYPMQVREMDEHGNLPLHIAAVALTFLPNDLSSGCDEDSFVSNLSNLSSVNLSRPFRTVIKMLLQSYPDAAHIPHGASGRLPLVLAFDAGQRSMDDGLKLLMEAFPAALETKEFDPKFYPYILSVLGKSSEKKVSSRKQRFRRFGRKRKEQVKTKLLPISLYDCLRARPQLLSNDE